MMLPRRRTRAGWLALAAALPGAAVLANCSSSSSDQGQIILAVQADMKVPEDVDEIRIEILARGRLLFGSSYDLDPSENTIRIPATLAILGGEDPTTPVTVRVISRQGAILRTLRQVVTTVPASRVATLRVPIQWLCDGKAIEPAPNQVDSTCPDGQSCVSGRCVDDEVDSETLPDFTAEDVYGGGTGEGDGTCIDTVGCFASGTGVTLAEDCTFPVTDTDSLNVAMVLPKGADGICGPEACLIPLDADEETGWFEKDGLVHLPPAVCEKIADGNALGVATTNACATKTPSVPTCGPWSAVTTQAASVDASAPANIQGTCRAPTDATGAAVCITLDPEEIELTPDPELDGVGALVVEAYDTPDFRSAEPIATAVLDGSDFNVGTLPMVRLEGLPATAYLFAALWDNPNETDLDFLRRGGGWLGGIDTTVPGLEALAPLQLDVGSGQAITLPMRAIRRLRLTMRLASDATLADDGAGRLQWLAYATPTPATDAVPVGVSEQGCEDLTLGPGLVEGFVFGKGPHYLVGTLDDFGLAVTSLAQPGSLAGSVLSGSPAADGWNAPDEITFASTKYTTSALIDLGHTVPVTMAPPSFQCVATTCSDGAINGTETDLDCGGSCAPCADGLTCAGPADCASRVCLASLCQIPNCADGVQNADETDADCGGGTCGPCGLGQGCLANADCSGTATCIVNVCTGPDSGATAAPMDSGAP